MNPMDGTGEETENAPTSHRRAGKAQVALPRRVGEPATPRFVDDLRDNFRLVLISVLAPGAAVVGGLGLLAFDETASTTQRAGGLAMVVLGLLVLTSYVLRFTAVLAGDAWSMSPARRAARLVLRYSWHAYLAVLGAVAAYEFVNWLRQR